MGTFKDSLKKWFYTNSSSAAASDARIPLLDASGNPKGSDTMYNIATVLGATKNLIPTKRLTFSKKEAQYNKEGGYWYIDVNLPFSDLNYPLLTVFNSRAGWRTGFDIVGSNWVIRFLYDDIPSGNFSGDVYYVTGM